MGLLLNGGAQDGGRFCFGVVLEGGRRVSRSNNGGARRGREIALVGLASVVDRRQMTERRSEDGRLRVGTVAGELCKTKTIKLDKI